MTNQPLTKQDLEEALERVLDIKLNKLRFDLETEIGKSTAKLIQLIDTRCSRIKKRLDAVTALANRHDAIIGYNLHIKKLKALPT